MAIFRLSAQVISRSSGKSVVAAAAYRAGEILPDHRQGMTWDYSRRQTVEHEVILTPANAPSWAQDRATLWNAVEASEKRRDAQLAREIQLALPEELELHDQVNLVEQWVDVHCVQKGMVADVAIHSDEGNPHAHVLLTLRPFKGDTFGGKERDWNKKEVLEVWRASWAESVNTSLAQVGIQDRVDHRSLEAQGIDREPKNLNRAAFEMERRGLVSRQGEAMRERQRLRDERNHHDPSTSHRTHATRPSHARSLPAPGRSIGRPAQQPGTLDLTWGRGLSPRALSLAGRPRGERPHGSLEPPPKGLDLRPSTRDLGAEGLRPRGSGHPPADGGKLGVGHQLLPGSRREADHPEGAPSRDRPDAGEAGESLPAPHPTHGSLLGSPDTPRASAAPDHRGMGEDLGWEPDPRLPSGFWEPLSLTLRPPSNPDGARGGGPGAALGPLGVPERGLLPHPLMAHAELAHQVAKTKAQEALEANQHISRGGLDPWLSKPLPRDPTPLPPPPGTEEPSRVQRMIEHFRSLWANVRQFAAVTQDALQHFREVQHEDRARESRRAAVDQWAQDQPRTLPPLPTPPKPLLTIQDRADAANRALQRLGIERTPFTPTTLREAAPSAIKAMLDAYDQVGLLSPNPDRGKVLQVHQAQLKRIDIEREGPELPGFGRGGRGR